MWLKASHASHSSSVSLPQLLARHLDHVPSGSVAGTCYICGLPTEVGFREKPSDNFTAWAQCFAGDVICPPCRAMLKDHRLRSRSWLASSTSILFRTSETKEAFFAALVDPPPPPVVAYVTQGGQRQGYLSIVWRVSMSPGQIWVGTDWLTAPVLLTQSWAREVAPLLRSLRNRGLPKSALLENPPPAWWQKAIEGGWEEELRWAGELRGDPRWEVMVVACP
jgi:hypothetical protein